MLIENKEVIRYLGYGRSIPDDRIIDTIEVCKKQALSVIQARHFYRRFVLPDISEGAKIIPANTNIDLTCESLKKNLNGCSEVIFFAATLGNGIDVLMNRFQKTAISKAAVLQAVGAAAIEAYCNECQKEIEEELLKEGLYLRPRFSPGYGDLPLTVQADFLKVLNAEKTVGIVLSEGGVMLPEKSVTALMGISNINSRCHIEGCESCSNNMTCKYKRF